MNIRFVRDRQIVDGVNWIKACTTSMAGEMGMPLDCPPECEEADLNVKLAVDVAGRREVLKLWRPDVADSQGGNNQATREMRQKLAGQVREWLRSLVEPKRRIGF